MPSPSVSTFSFPSTTEPVFSASTSEPVFESPNHSQTSQTTQSQQLQQYHTTTVSNNNAKFPYLKKEEYETWAMKMEYWIMNSDHNLWNNCFSNDNSKKRQKNPKGKLLIPSPVSVEEQDSKLEVQKILSQLNHMHAKPKHEDCNMKVLRALPPSCHRKDVAYNATGDVADDDSNVAAEFVRYGISSQAKLEKLNDKVNIEGYLMQDLTNGRSWFDLSAPSIFDSSPKDVAEKPLYDRFVKAVGMHVVPPPITGTFMPPSNKPDLDDTQVTYGSKSNNYFETNSVSNDFVSCDNSDKSSDSETTGFASCVSSVQSSSSKTNEPLASAPSSVDFKTMSETVDQQPSSTNVDSSFSFKENVKPPRNLCNKSGINRRSLCKRKSFCSKTCFVCGSKFYLIKDCDFYEKQLELHNKPMWNNVANIPSFVPKAASVPAGSRNRPTSVPAGSRNRPTSVPAGSRNRPTSVPAGSRNRPTSVPAGRPFSAGWKNHAARPMTRPTSHYFQHFSRPGYYNQMYMDEGRWGTADNPHKNKDLGIVDSGCSRSMTGNKEKLDDFVKIVGGTVTFGGGDGKITRKGTIRTSKLNFENVYYVEELQNFNLFSVSQICDTKNKVLFTDKECLVLSKEFQLPENSQVVLRVPRRNNLYCFNLSDIQPERDVTCLLAKASLDESTKWHRRMAHGIKRDYSNARTPQQNGVAERKNRTLIEAARTMLADSKLPTMFWTEAVSTACYVLNRVLVTRPHNKTPYELLSGKVPNISHLKPFGLVKAYRVYNLSSKKIEETLNLRYLEDKPNVQGLGHEWYFDLDYLTDSLGYTRFKTNQPAGTQDTNIHAGTQDDSDSECDEQLKASDSGLNFQPLGNRVPAGRLDSAAGFSYGYRNLYSFVKPVSYLMHPSLPPSSSWSLIGLK
ncbi:ribonuclease H-like domain-containing protein [Tanacetum coccineum]